MTTHPVERFATKFEVATSGCWQWMAATNGHGYGRFYIGRRGIGAHRFAYETSVGPIPDGAVLDHLCRNRACVNPDHLEVVTQGENLRRGYAARGPRTHCPRRHEFTSDNTYINKRGARVCRQCRQAAVRSWKERNR